MGDRERNWPPGIFGGPTYKLSPALFVSFLPNMLLFVL